MQFARFEGGEVVGGPAGEFAAEVGFDFDAVIVEPVGGLIGARFHQRDDDGAVVEGAGELADAGENGGAEGAERTDGVAFAFAAVSASAALVAGVEEAAEFVGLREPGVYFVEEEGGLILVDEAEQDRSGKIFGAEGAGRQGGDDIEGGGFAAAGFGRGDVEARGLDERGKTVGVSGPEGESFGCAGWKEKIVAEAVEDLDQDFGAIHGFGPGKW